MEVHGAEQHSTFGEGSGNVDHGSLLIGMTKIYLTIIMLLKEMEDIGYFCMLADDAQKTHMS
jgi:hypothetical protein